jgi:hypothetical protein
VVDPPPLTLAEQVEGPPQHERVALGVLEPVLEGERPEGRPPLRLQVQADRQRGDRTATTARIPRTSIALGVSGGTSLQ